MSMMFGGWAREEREEREWREADKVRRAMARIAREGELRRQAEDRDRSMFLHDDWGPLAQSVRAAGS